MSWFGKMVGGTIGLVLGGPLGAIAGGAIGHHLFDKEHPEETSRAGGTFGGGGFARSSVAEQRQMTFFLALFSILGKLAKADGRVSREEGEQIVAFLDQMNVSGEQRSFAIRVFNEAKDSSYSVEDFAQQFAEFSRGRHDLRSSMMDMLFRIALADGEFHPAEDAMIASVAQILGISNQELQTIRERYVATAHQAYATLGVNPDADDDEVKGAYRKLVHEHHPDRIVSEGMPEEFVEYATRRFQEIQDAWQTIRKERNL
ncbi:MAG: TerB family tellurite resistance protein [Alkalispirochaeta sp.]